MEIKSRHEQKTICRKCKTAFLSVDFSPCPTCSERNKELALKREANRAKKDGDVAAEELPEMSD